MRLVSRDSQLPRASNVCFTTSSEPSAEISRTRLPKSVRKGVVAYVLKPFERAELLKAVAAGVDWSRTATQQGQKRLGDAKRLPAAPQ